MRPDTITFVVVATVVVITPGLDMVLVARNGIAGGMRVALKTTAGILTGVAVHALAATIGLSAILASSATAFQTVRVAGGAYLLYLGARSLWLSRRDARPTEIAPNVSERPFLTGLMTNLLNPKVAILFLSLLPQFVSTSDSLLARTAQLASIFLVIGDGLAYLLLVGCCSGPAGPTETPCHTLRRKTLRSSPDRPGDPGTRRGSMTLR